MCDSCPLNYYIIDNGKWINRWVELRDTRLFYYKDSQVGSSNSIIMCVYVLIFLLWLV